jgi:hypothetical protein
LRFSSSLEILSPSKIAFISSFFDSPRSHLR